jgi:subtilisin-like proprotein convertase family protein
MRLRLALGLALVTLPAYASADVLRPTLGQPLTEVSHAVAVSIADGVAIYKVRRVFANAGARADEAALEIDLPPGAAATGLRIRARDRWYDGELMEREKAAAMYRELTGMGTYEPKDPALLQWVWADKLYLQVFPVLPGATSTVEYTLTVPTAYEGGQIFLSYPRLAAAAGATTAKLATPIITIHPTWGNATTRIVVDGQRVTPDAPVVLATPIAPAWLDQVGGDAGASYVASEVTVPEVATTKGTFAEAKVTLDISHTYKSDLRVVLLTPAGEKVDVFGGDAGGVADGSGNDIKATFPVKLPARTRGAGTWRLVVSDHVARDAGTVNEWTLALGTGKTPYAIKAADTPVFVPDAPESENDAGLASIVVAPPAIDVAEVRLGKVVASDAHAFSRLEIDAAPELRPLPKKAQVVFAIDGSHSAGPAGIAAQLAIVRAYFAHVPDAEVEVVVYRRTAKRVFGSFVAGKDVAAKLAAAEKLGAFIPGNGSALDDGARLATAALAGRKGPLRVVITTDKLLRSSFTNALALAGLGKLPASAVVHVVAPKLDDGEDAAVTLVRDDTDSLAKIAAAHRGIYASLGGLPAKTDKPVIDAALGLVRPIRVDHFAIAGIEVAGAPETLEEGDGIREVRAVTKAKASNRVVLTGKIWGDAYRKEVAVDAAFSRAAAAFVFSEDDHTELSEAEMMKVALMGRAVSPVTSYLAIEPGVRPSTIGIPLEGRGGTGSGFGAGGGAGYLRGGEIRTKPDLMALVADRAKACVAKHKPAADWNVTVEVETTKDEVVDVATTSKLPIAACLVEAVWAVRLDSRWNLEREEFTLDFR